MSEDKITELKNIIKNKDVIISELNVDIDEKKSSLIEKDNDIILLKNSINDLENIKNELQKELDEKNKLLEENNKRLEELKSKINFNNLKSTENKSIQIDSNNDDSNIPNNLFLAVPIALMCIGWAIKSSLFGV